MQHKQIQSKVCIAVLSVWLAVVSTFPASANMTATIQLDQQILVKRSEAPAYFKRIIHLYDAAIFSSQDASLVDVLDADSSSCLVLYYRRSIPKSAFAKAAEKVLRRQLGDVEFATISDSLDRLNKAFDDVNEGDNYRFCRLAGGSVRLYRGERLVLNLQDAAFGRHYLGIWLDKNGLSKRLRTELSRFN